MVDLNWPRRFRFSSHIKSVKSLTRSIIALQSVIPGKMGDMKHTVRMPASYISFIAFRREAMVDAQSISALKLSSRVLTENDTVTFLNVFSKSMSRNTRSDLVQIIISASDPCNSFNISRVRPNRSS